MLAINESKTDGSISDTEVYIPGYIIIRNDRSRLGGGVALALYQGEICRTQIELTFSLTLWK